MGADPQSVKIVSLEKARYIELMTDAFREGIRYACAHQQIGEEQLATEGVRAFRRGLGDSLENSIAGRLQ